MIDKINYYYYHLEVINSYKICIFNPCGFLNVGGNLKMVDNRIAFCSCGEKELVLWEEDPLKKKFEIIKRCVLFETNDNVAGSVCWSEDSILTS